MRVIPGSFGKCCTRSRTSESNPPLYYVLGLGLGEGVRHRRGRPALALGPVRRRHGAGRLPDRPPAGDPPRRPRPGGADRRQPDADLVLAGGALLRAAGLLRRRSRCSSSCGRWTRAGGATSPVGRWPRRWRSAATTSPSSRSGSRRSGCWWRCGRAGGSCCRRSPLSAPPAWRCCRWPTRRPTRPTSAGSKTAPWPNASGRPAVSFLVGETGHVIAEAPRERYALVPLVLVGACPGCWSPSGASAASGAGPGWAGAGPRRRRR